MADNLPNTRSGLAADAILRAWLADMQAIDLDEAMTNYRKEIRERIERLKALISLIPDIETDSAVLVLLGCTTAEARDRLAFAAGGAMAPVA